MSRENAFKGMVSTKKDAGEVQIRDTFQTPRYATELLIPFIPKNIKWVWEPACGDGRIVKVLSDSGLGVYPSDIVKSSGWVNNHVINFMTDERPTVTYTLGREWAIITNPPFSIKEKFVEKCFKYEVPFALLMGAEYSAQMINWIRRGCEKIIPTARISYLTPNMLRRINDGEDLIDGNSNGYSSIDEVPEDLLYKYSAAQFHSLWLTYGFGLGRTETFVDLPVEKRKEIL